MVWKIILSAVLGYLLGCIPTGVLVAKIYGVRDIRTLGSGNSGTTNVLRNLGWLPSVLTLVGDCLKGYVACLIGKQLGGDAGMLAGGLCAILGHDFPVFMGFKGGKGIATSLGLIIAINPWLALALLAVQIIAVALTRYMSVASLITTVAFPILVCFTERGRENFPLFLGAACIASVLSLFGHRGNIQRLIRGEENRLDFVKICKVSEKVMAKMRNKNP
ncbi:MAG: glycerol-3-phosphate 1-O-acyltransferase PlsY [Clostridia bacterium]|nr:glycerol-3-phosphate 1-O-acyltransferase PlsY [Clostridia bacterium]MBQ6121241.1 glycerol-3-phosphate 1-O-acyltransferase PlsY [Clostridia bacterium]